MSFWESVESELNNSIPSADPTADQQNQIRLYKKYFELINLAEKLNEQQLKSIENLMKTM